MPSKINGCDLWCECLTWLGEERQFAICWRGDFGCGVTNALFIMFGFSGLITDRKAVLVFTSLNLLSLS